DARRRRPQDRARQRGRADRRRRPGPRRRARDHRQPRHREPARRRGRGPLLVAQRPHPARRRPLRPPARGAAHPGSRRGARDRRLPARRARALPLRGRDHRRAVGGAMIPGRRRFLAGLGALAAARLVAPRSAAAMGRTPLGGRASFHVPWPTTSLDPHDLHDPMAALFGAAVADPVFAVDATNAPYAALTAGMPAREAGETVVRLREGMRTARLAPLDARDLVFSVERAREHGASALLADIPKPHVRSGDPLAASFGAIEPMHLARALASPLCALLPRHFDPAAPDGTGAFRAELGASGLLLTRNTVAARGPSFLDTIEVAPAPDLKTSLRDFEAEQDDLGWLGMGLHDQRKSAVPFDLGRVAWVVLVIGPDAGPASVPGTAQRLVDAIPPERLAHLALGPLPSSGGDPSWPGPPADMLVDDASPHL